eukprot:COSAG06_NODE_19601_length_831_cov_0.844262_2_plen_132_part_01
MTSVATAVLLLAISTTAVAVHPTVAEAQRHVRRLRAAGVAREIVLDLSAGVHPIELKSVYLPRQARDKRNAKKTIRMQQKRAFDTGVSSNPSEWRRSGHGPVIGLKDPVVDLSGSKHTSLQSMHARAEVQDD